MEKLVEKNQQFWTTKRPDEQTRSTIKRLCSKETVSLAYETLPACQVNMLWQRYGKSGSFSLHPSFFRWPEKAQSWNWTALGSALCSADHLQVMWHCDYNLYWLSFSFITFKSCKLGGWIRAAFTKYITHFWWFLICWHEYSLNNDTNEVSLANPVSCQRALSDVKGT